MSLNQNQPQSIGICNRPSNNLKKIISTCVKCELGNQNQYAFPRGNPNAKKMIIGECPGLVEIQKRSYFVGPAGTLLDKIFKAAGWNTNKDWYITNITKCRWPAPPNSGKQNQTPLKKHRDACLPYLFRELSDINPKIVVLAGKSAVDGLLGATAYKSMKEMAGKILFDERFPEQTFFVIYHPAYLLHSQRFADKYLELKKDMWEHIKLLKELSGELHV